MPRVPARTRQRAAVPSPKKLMDDEGPGEDRRSRDKDGAGSLGCVSGTSVVKGQAWVQAAQGGGVPRPGAWGPWRWN